MSDYSKKKSFDIEVRGQSIDSDALDQNVHPFEAWEFYPASTPAVLRLTDGWTLEVMKDLNVEGDIIVGGDLDVTGVVTGGGGIAAGTGNATLLKKLIEIGDWNMNANASVAVIHGLTLANIISFDFLVRSDTDDRHTKWSHTNTTAVPQIWPGVVNATTVTLCRLTGGEFNSTNYDSTSYNRGWIIIEYIP